MSEIPSGVDSAVCVGSFTHVLMYSRTPVDYVRHGVLRLSLIPPIRSSHHAAFDEMR